MSRRLYAALGVLLFCLALAAPASAQDGVQHLEFAYGPVKIAPGQNTPDEVYITYEIDFIPDGAPGARGIQTIETAFLDTVGGACPAGAWRSRTSSTAGATSARPAGAAARRRCARAAG